MNKETIVDKTQHRRADYAEIHLKCPICIQIKKISKTFKKPYTLQYHLTTAHDHDDEITSKISINEVRDTVRTVIQAYQWNMFCNVRGCISLC